MLFMLLRRECRSSFLDELALFAIVSTNDRFLMEALLWQQLIKIVPRDTARNVRVTSTHQVGRAIAQGFQLRIHLTSPSSFGNNACQFLLAGGPHAQTQAIIRDCCSMEILQWRYGKVSGQR